MKIIIILLFIIALPVIIPISCTCITVGGSAIALAYMATNKPPTPNSQEWDKAYKGMKEFKIK